MIFREDLEIQINEDGKINKKDLERLYGEFCKHYINQIKDKLNFNYTVINILKEKKENASQLKTNPTTLHKTILSNEEVLKRMIRFEMRMINVVNRLNRQEHKGKPKISRKQNHNKPNYQGKEEEVNK